MGKTFRNLAALAAFAFAGTAFADPISISAGCPGDADCDATVDDTYSFLWTVAGGAGNETDGFTTFDVTLENTSPDTTPEALIDEFAFNLAEDFLETELTFSDVTPDSWEITYATGGIKFDYVGDTQGTPANRLGSGDILSFTMNFTSAQTYDLFLNAGASDGGGFGGGEDSGQVCVSFQQLGDNGQSDLVCGEYGDTPTKVSEPATLGLLGLGLLGVGFVRRRRLAA